LNDKHVQLSKKGGFNNRLLKIKLLVAVWVGKTLILLTRILGRGGTTYPGRTAMKIAPDLSFSFAGNMTEGSLVITGTNGKTTTSALLSSILKEAGLRCIHNQSGSNLAWGVASAFINSANWLAKLHGDYAVMEVDEGAFPGVVRSIKPRGVVATNIFRDQLDRYGEIDYIQKSIRKGLEAQPAGGFQVINADDPSLVSIENITGNQRLTYGLELDLPVDSFQNTGRDMKSCPRCYHKLVYDRVFFAHLGHFHCPSCSFKRPEPDIKLTGLKVKAVNSVIVKINFSGEETEIPLKLAGTYNLYNVLAASACAWALKIPTEFIVRALEKAAPSYGRMELFELGNKSIIIALIKNPVGANEVIRTVLAQAGSINLLIAINDKVADGTDVSWLWDVDFEQLVAENQNLSTVLVSGLRAWDMAVRLKYAGLDPELIQVENNTARAIIKGLEQTAPGERFFILPTYTAMLEIRRHLNKMGLGKPYWED
jgi:lipid II isoglutaminyl synthase (glutamine-hydrolysing)